MGVAVPTGSCIPKVYWCVMHNQSLLRAALVELWLTPRSADVASAILNHPCTTAHWVMFVVFIYLQICMWRKPSSRVWMSFHCCKPQFNRPWVIWLLLQHCILQQEKIFVMLQCSIALGQCQICVYHCQITVHHCPFGQWCSHILVTECSFVILPSRSKYNTQCLQQLMQCEPIPLSANLNL